MRGKRSVARSGARSVTRSRPRSRSRSRSEQTTGDGQSCSNSSSSQTSGNISIRVTTKRVKNDTVKEVNKSAGEKVVLDVTDQSDKNQPDDGDDLKCLICANLYKDPRLLHCMHTFCNGCIEKLQDHDHLQTALVCPICQFRTKVGADGRLTLWRNHVIQQKVRWMEISSQRNKSAFLCTNCETETATKLCADCQLKLCEVCTTHHKHTKRFNDHTIQSIEAVSNEDLLEKAIIRCTFHCQEMRHFCESCSMAVCGECLHSKAHQRHLFLPLTEVVDKELKQLCKTVNESMEVCKEYEDYLGKAEQFYKKSIEERDASKILVENEYTKLMEILQADKQHLLMWLDERCELGANELRMAKEKVSHVKTMSSYLEEVIKYPKEEVFDIIKDGGTHLKNNILSMRSVPGTTEGKEKNDFNVKISLRQVRLSPDVSAIRKPIHQVGLPSPQQLPTTWSIAQLDRGFIFDETDFPGPAGVCMFEVRNIRKISKVTCSQQVNIGDFLWKIMLKPAFHVKGDGSNVLGFNLYRAAEISVVCEPVETHTSWQCKAYAEIILKNHCGEDLKRSSTYTWMNDSDTNSSEGVNCILAWEDLLDPRKGYIKDESVTINARIQIIP